MTNKARELTQAEIFQKESWRNCPIDKRLEHIPTIIIPHPQFSHAVLEIERRANRVNIQSKGAALCIIAATGGGKTTLTKKISALYSDEEAKDKSIRRSVYFSVPPRPSSGSMSSAVLEALGDPRWDKGKAHELEFRVIHLLKECQTEIILMDNTHDIPERRKAKGVREVGNWVRNIIDKVPALFVALGAEQGLDVFKANSQVRRRSPASIRIDYFNCLEKGGVARLRRFLFELDIQLPLAELSDLSAFNTTKRIWVATNGIQDYIINLLTEAVEIAVANRREKITLEDLKKGFDSMFEDGRPELNPFAVDALDFRTLDREGEPFEDWLNDGYE